MADYDDLSVGQLVETVAHINGWQFLRRLLAGGTRLASLSEGTELITALSTRASVYNSANITVNNNNATAITFDSEDFDTDSFHEGVTNPGRLTAAVAGKYRVTFRGEIAVAAAVSGYAQVDLRLDGVSKKVGYGAMSNAGAAAARAMLMIDYVIAMTANQYIDFQVTQLNSGSNNGVITGGATGFYAQIERVE